MPTGRSVVDVVVGFSMQGWVDSKQVEEIVIVEEVDQVGIE